MELQVEKNTGTTVEYSLLQGQCPWTRISHTVKEMLKLNNHISKGCLVMNLYNIVEVLTSVSW
jgi:hypothetical protein